MSKKLAIKGDKERGNEVIALLKMLGGDNTHKLTGHIGDDIVDPKVYFLDKLDIRWEYFGCLENDGRLKEMKVFTLDEFYKKHPYKIGYWVRIPEYESEVRISKMKWNGYNIEYMVYRNDNEDWYTAKELKNWNDIESCKGVEYNDIKVSYLSINDKEYADEIEVNLGDDYEYKFEMNRLYICKKKPLYPKTYQDCHDILDNENKINVFTICNFAKLLEARNAYWKIAGEKMGLDKPWEPIWYSNIDDEKYAILKHGSKITKCKIQDLRNAALIFPTAEMRDTFYENFKDLIERCKDLL